MTDADFCDRQIDQSSDLDETARISTYTSIADELERAIIAGDYTPHCPLPSSRVLAQQYCVSRATALAAFGILSRKGLIKISHGKRPTVACFAKEVPLLELSFAPDQPDEQMQSGNLLGWLPEYLPARKWFGLISNQARKAHNDGKITDADALLELKFALRNYLSRQRQIRACLEQIFMFENPAAALSALTELVDLGTGSKLLVDAPNLSDNVRLLARRTNCLQAVSLDSPLENGILQGLSGAEGRLLYTTPSMRLGSPRSLNKAAREAVLDWARETGCYIIEHDIGHEFCSGPSSHPAIFSLDQSISVIYLLDFSQSLSPLTNLCAAVVPRPLANLLRRHHYFKQSSCLQFECLALTSLLKTGYLESYTKKIGQLAMQNLCQFKKLLGECEKTKSATTLRLVKSGKEAILELAPEISADLLIPAIQKGMLVPANRLFGLESSPGNRFLLSGDRLNEQNRRFILSCLAKSPADDSENGFGVAVQSLFDSRVTYSTTIW